MTAFSSIRCEFNFSGSVWTDVNDDVLGGIPFEAGINGWGPHDRVAKTGKLTLVLENNGNEYTPNHINVRSGFEEGCPFRLIVVYDGIESTRFYGEIDTINVDIGGQIAHRTYVTIKDYINKMAVHELQLPDFTTNKRIDEVVPLVIANMPIAPLSTDYHTGQDTFATVFDVTRPQTRALSEVSKVVASELGYAYVRPTWLYDESLVVEGRYTRTDREIKYVTDPTDYITTEDGLAFITEDEQYIIMEGSTEAILEGYLEGVSTEYGKHHYNHVKTKTYPREVDASATAVLFSLNRFITIPVSETVKVTARFADPSQKAQSVAGRDMVTPVATTDYLMNAASDGTGADLTADLAVTATYGANGVEYQLENTGASTGYVTKLQARGRGVYIYDMVEYNVENAADIAADGRRTLTIDMLYQDNPLVGADFASNLLDLYGSKQFVINGITYCPNDSLGSLMMFMDLHIGDKINIIINEINVDGYFYINSIKGMIGPADYLSCHYGVIPESFMPSSDYWELGTAGRSEIGETTKLGF